MSRDRPFTVRLCASLIVALMLIAPVSATASAQQTSEPGWYGPFDNGCLNWWDGYQWTGDLDCDGDGNVDSVSSTDLAGWYGPYDDGCLYWWDGYQWTGDLDCDGDGYADAVGATYPAGWYGPYDDGCNHWWDGDRWTAEIDCDFDGDADPEAATYPADWYGPYDDGCFYWWDGNQWTNLADCDGDGSADEATLTYPAGWYGPFDDGCLYWWDGDRYTGESDCDGDGETDTTTEIYQPGWYDLYQDGCLYWFDGNLYNGDIDCDRDGKADTEQRPDDIDTTSTDEFIDNQVEAINQMWGSRFAGEGLIYSDPVLVIAVKPISVGCRTSDGDQLLETEDWIFYCSVDEAIYFGPGNLDRVVQSGIGAVQLMVAHEIGHHVQSELDPNFDAAYAANPVLYEDQATCMAGIWFNQLDAEGKPSDIDTAMTYLSTASDEVHGSGDAQVAALLKGYHDPSAC